uniref:AlNc14C239G9450 protein n=1 Tax=Albugo laibachii Nc14 TaxID=890382 RepID=F0WSV9_9STRA|nr:AlNc14C239G9450 [Albugo laibachii Nc14]|eukprot:CCA24443.1 AlNc14C239G9450 [Albugo laibachii Nc14]
MMQATRSTTKKPAWNASTKTTKPAPTNATTSTTKRIGGGYAPRVSATTRRPAATSRTTLPTTTRITTPSVVTRTATQATTRQPRSTRNVVETRVDLVGGGEVTRVTPAMLSRPSAARTVRSGAQSTASRVGCGVITRLAPLGASRLSTVARAGGDPIISSVQAVASGPSQVQLNEVTKLKKQNANLQTALDEKTIQLRDALKEVRGLKERLEASRIQKAKVQRNLEYVVKMQQEISDQFSQKYEEEVREVKERSCREVNVQHQAIVEVSNGVTHGKKEGANQINGNARMIEDILPEERSEQRTPYPELEITRQHSEKNRNRGGREHVSRFDR